MKTPAQFRAQQKYAAKRRFLKYHTLEEYNALVERANQERQELAKREAWNEMAAILKPVGATQEPREAFYPGSFPPPNNNLANVNTKVTQSPACQNTPTDPDEELAKFLNPPKT